MKKILLISAAICLVAGFTGKVSAQDNVGTDDITYQLDAMKYLDIKAPTSNAALTINSLSMTTPGQSVSDQKDGGRIQYTSIIADADSRYDILAKLNTAVQDWTTLTVSTGNITRPTGNTQTLTDFGTAAGDVTLTADDAILVSDIKSCWTGTGSSDGRLLTYKWSINDYSQAVAIDQTAKTVTYTIVEHSN